MSTPLGQFLAELATDPKKYEEYISDPDEAVRAAELSCEDQVAIRSGNAAAIQGRLAGSNPENRAATDLNCHTILWAVSTPGSQP